MNNQPTVFSQYDVAAVVVLIGMTAGLLQAAAKLAG